MGGVQGRGLSLPRPLVVEACGWGPLPTGCGCSVRVWGPALSTRRASLQALRSVGDAVCLGTFSHAVLRCLVCALRGFAAPSGRCSLVPLRVPWFWPAACLSGVPRGPAWFAAPCPVRLLSGLWSAFPSLWCLPLPGAFASGFTERLHVARGGRREPGAWCLPRARAKAGALGSLSVVPVWRPAMGFSVAGPSILQPAACKSLGGRPCSWPHHPI